MAWRILPLVALTLGVSHPAIVEAQLTGEESRIYSKLLTEPDGQPAYEKRLRLIGDAIEREADPKWRPVSSIQVDLKGARIPAAEGVPFLLKRLDHSAGAVGRAGVRMVGA